MNIKELEIEGAKISWDELKWVAYKVIEKAINIKKFSTI